jgi:hypothetical protein
MGLSTTHYTRCIQTLESSLAFLGQAEEDSIDFKIFRNAVELDDAGS